MGIETAPAHHDVAAHRGGGDVIGCVPGACSYREASRPVEPLDLEAA